MGFSDNLQERTAQHFPLDHVNRETHVGMNFIQQEQAGNEPLKKNRQVVALPEADKGDYQVATLLFAVEPHVIRDLFSEVAFGSVSHKAVVVALLRLSIFRDAGTLFPQSRTVQACDSALIASDSVACGHSPE